MLHIIIKLKIKLLHKNTIFILYLLPNIINTLTIGNLQKVNDSEKILLIIII